VGWGFCIRGLMTKHRFTAAERYAVFTAHGEKCYLCHKPITMRTMEVDHIVPETLLDDPPRRAAVLAALGRQSEFEINSFANWMPACGPCNNEKRDAVFEPTPIVQIQLQHAAEKAAEAQQLVDQVVSERKLSNAVNVIAQANESGVLAAWVVEAIRPLVVFHIVHRDPDMAAEPIRITRDFAVVLEVEFNDGPRNGQLLASGSHELDVHKGLWLLRVTAPFITRVERGGPKPKSYLTWKQPCKDVVDLANARGWSEEERQNRMKYHIYEVKEYEWTENAIRFKAYYQGIE
jgi:hypothetical protein